MKTYNLINDENSESSSTDSFETITDYFNCSVAVVSKENVEELLSKGEIPILLATCPSQEIAKLVYSSHDEKGVYYVPNYDGEDNFIYYDDEFFEGAEYYIWVSGKTMKEI